MMSDIGCMLKQMHHGVMHLVSCSTVLLQLECQHFSNEQTAELAEGFSQVHHHGNTQH